VQLPEPLTGKTISLADVSGSKATLVMFICNHCPYVVLLKQGIIDLAKDYASQGVGVVAISSNSAASHPQDGPELMAKDAKDLGYPFPYLYDESQDVAKVLLRLQHQTHPWQSCLSDGGCVLVDIP
jgi:thiol-disulfide isomerase/thioredoxin